jgi:selenide, water dikinase
MLNALPRGSKSMTRLIETKDDAAVVQLTPELVLVQTVDFFTPMVDDPYWFGQIAAANSLSDVYAMGARPLTAMNLVAWPVSLGMAPLADILRGGLEKIEEAGAELAGGHSIDDKEPKYGLAVTGVAHPDEIVYNGGARPGDLLVLTKRLGIGVLATALKQGVITEEEMMPTIREAATLNDAASRAMGKVGVNAATDVTGFGLLGHLAEMLDASGGGEMERELPVGARVYTTAVPLQDGVLDLVRAGVYAGGLRANRDFLAGRIAGMPLDDPLTLALFDPQTSGGLLMAVTSERHRALLDELLAAGVSAWTVGEIIASPSGAIELQTGAADD